MTHIKAHRTRTRTNMLRGEVGARIARRSCSSTAVYSTQRTTTNPPKIIILPLYPINCYIEVSMATQPFSIVRPSELLDQSKDVAMTVTGLARSVFYGVIDGPSQLPVEGPETPMNKWPHHIYYYCSTYITTNERPNDVVHVSYFTTACCF